MRFPFFWLVILVAGSGLVAWSQDKSASPVVTVDLVALEESVYANDKPETAQAKALSQAFAAESAVVPGRDRQLRLAQILSYQAIFHRQHGRNQDADQALTQAETLAQAVHSANDSWSSQVLATVRSQLMGVRGLGYIMANGGAINDLALKTLQLDPGNIAATTIIAYGKINTPPIFGGNPDLAVEMLQKLLVRGDITKVQRFNAYIGLVRAFKKKNDGPQRLKALEAARQIFPANLDLAVESKG